MIEHQVIPARRLRIERFARTLQRLGLPDFNLAEMAFYLSLVFGVMIVYVVGMGVWMLRKLERGEAIYS